MEVFTNEQSGIESQNQTFFKTINISILLCKYVVNLTTSLFA
jgi:hypothetical protein